MQESNLTNFGSDINTEEEDEFFGSSASMARLHEASAEDDIEINESGGVSPFELERLSNLNHRTNSHDMQFLDRETPDIVVSSFFDIPETQHIKFSVGEFFPSEKKDDDIVVSVNLDSELPINSLKIIDEHREELQLKVSLLNILSETSFENLDISLVRYDEKLNPLSNEHLNNIITQLILNKTVRTDKPLVQKLYKLKNIEELVNTSMSIDDVEFNFNSRLSQIKEMILKYEAIVKKEVLSQMRILGSGTRKVDENIIDGLKAQISSLEEFRDKCSSLKKEISKYEQLENLELFEDCENFNEILIKIENFKVFSELSHLELFADCESNFEIIKKIKSLSVPSDKLSDVLLEQLRLIEGFDGLIDEEIINKIVKLIEQNKFYSELISEHENDNGSNENKELSSQITQLAEQVKLLTSENEELKNKTLPKEETVKPTYQEALNEIDDEEEDDELTKEPGKKMGLGKKIGIGIGIFFSLIFVYFFIISFLGVTEQQSPIAKKEFANAVKPSVTEIKPLPLVDSTAEKKISEAIAAVVEPVLMDYDFNAVISEDVFKVQKFDIYVDDSRKVRVNGKNFVAGETINNYKFIRTLSSGKILFMNVADGKSLWLMMN